MSAIPMNLSPSTARVPAQDVLQWKFALITMRGAIVGAFIRRAHVYGNVAFIEAQMADAKTVVLINLSEVRSIEFTTEDRASQYGKVIPP